MKNIAYSRNDFWNNIPDDCKQAINELKRMKVYECCAWDYEENFAHVWWLVLHEVDMYAEGHFGMEKWHYDIGGMYKEQAKRADKWLIKHLPLFNKYKKMLPNDFNENEFYYNGQI